MLLMAGGADSASARGEPAPPKQAAKPNPGPVMIVVSIARQKIHVYGADGLIAQSVVSTGQPGHRTPTGLFTVIQKNRYHHSNIYSGAPMPFMQRITWSGVALHAGVIPGYPASHGCIRLPHHFAVELWGMTKMGARVVVSPEETPVVEFVSPQLPVPLFTPVEELSPEQGKPELVSLQPGGGDGAATPTPPSRLVNPFERAKIVKVQTAADAIAKGKAAKAAVELSTLKAQQANKAIAALRAAELTLAAAKAKLEAATKALDSVKTPEAAEKAKAAVAAAEAKVAEASKGQEEAAAQEAIATPEALAAARGAWEAENASKTASALAKTADKGTEPISIFISKKTNKLYVRQGWLPIHEAPVTIRDAEQAIGTHTYLATEPTADGKGLRWLSLTFPAAKPAARNDDDDDDDDDRPRRRGKTVKVVEAPAKPFSETAGGALQRIEMPEETRQFIAERLWIGGSIIISDQPTSNETGVYTDFIVQPR